MLDLSVKEPATTSLEVSSPTAGEPLPARHSGTFDRAASIAVHGAKVGSQTLIKISVYVQHNPVVVKVFCCFAGLTLSFFTLLSMFNVIDDSGEDEEDEGWTFRERVETVYILLFGLVIFVCDAKEEWANKCFNVQSRLFQYFYFLATQRGRACFYFYVGSSTLLLLPESDAWKIIYIVLGSVLCFLGLIMIGLTFCSPPVSDPEALPQ